MQRGNGALGGYAIGEVHKAALAPALLIPEHLRPHTAHNIREAPGWRSLQSCLSPRTPEIQTTAEHQA